MKWTIWETCKEVDREGRVDVKSSLYLGHGEISLSGSHGHMALHETAWVSFALGHGRLLDTTKTGYPPTAATLRFESCFIVGLNIDYKWHTIV